MTFEEHLVNCRRPDGSFDLVAAEKARATEIASTPGAADELAKKAAHAERIAYEASEGDHRRKQFALGFEQLSLLDLEVLIPLGESTAVRLGDMDQFRIRIREDLANENFLKHSRAYDAEMTFWRSARKLLPPDSTIGDLP